MSVGGKERQSVRVTCVDDRDIVQIGRVTARLMVTYCHCALLAFEFRMFDGHSPAIKELDKHTLAMLGTHRKHSNYEHITNILQC